MLQDYVTSALVTSFQLSELKTTSPSDVISASKTQRRLICRTLINYFKIKNTPNEKLESLKKKAMSQTILVKLENAQEPNNMTALIKMGKVWVSVPVNDLTTISQMLAQTFVASLDDEYIQNYKKPGEEPEG